ncbi:AAA family ATPase, partial [Candidatus Gottesmanbacteria bacterium]|nr:AAA family ATPase [Candidatus Gottesmanbacteria bacterium]
MRTQDVLDLERVKTELDKTHYGLTEIKERVLEYVAVLKLLNVNNQNALTKAPILCFIGLAGTGKTTIAEGIAVSLGRRFVRVPLGGMGSSLELRGQTEALPNSEPGQIIKALRRCQIKNPVILLDE